MPRAKPCPACGAKTIRIVYGMPTPETFQKADRGEIALGGCMVFPDQPDRVCTGPEQHQLLRGALIEGFDEDQEEA